MRSVWWFLPPLAISVIPAFWMAIIWYVQLFNVLTEPRYWREFSAVSAFWIGLFAAIWFFWRSIRNPRANCVSKINIALILIGIVGAVWEGILLIDDPKVGLPIWLLALAPLSWVIVGFIARVTPN